MLTALVLKVLIILTAGLFAALACRRLSISVLVGYLVVGVLIGEGLMGIVIDTEHQIEYIAEAGVLLLLFSIGLEFSLEELIGLGRNFFVGGAAQMLLVAIPVAALLLWFGIEWQAACLLAAAVSFSSTVLVFKALSEWGQLGVPHGRRSIGILLFQDAALIPLLLVIPLLTGDGQTAGIYDYARLAGTSLLFVGSVVFIRRLIARSAIPALTRYRSPDLIVLFTLVMLGGVTMVAYLAGLPPAIGAFASGLIFSGNRWTEQIDALIFPFRESFAAIFFVSLGLIANPAFIWEEPLLFLGCLAGMVLLKALAAGIALMLTGLHWRPSLGMGIGLAHIGEFAFVLVLLGLKSDAISELHYQRMVTVALASLVISPFLMRFGLDWARAKATDDESLDAFGPPAEVGSHAIVIGAGPAGRQIASRLETVGHEVCVVDTSPVNLHVFSQQGFRTISGDATRFEILYNARVQEATVVIVCISDDDTATRITQSVRQMNPDAMLIIRCRYHGNAAKISRLGADRVVSEEAVASEALVRLLDDHYSKR